MKKSTVSAIVWWLVAIEQSVVLALALFVLVCCGVLRVPVVALVAMAQAAMLDAHLAVRPGGQRDNGRGNTGDPDEQ